MKRQRTILRPAAVLSITVACVTGLTRPAESQSSASQPAATRPADAAPAVGPIAYYVANCARCHGDIAEPYLGLDQPKRGQDMVEAIEEMAAGPAQAPLEPDALRQQVALHNAIFDKKPFVWIDPTRRDAVAGEVLPGTTLSFEGPDGTSAPPVKDNRFELPRRPVTLIGKRGGHRVRLPVAMKEG